MHVYIILSNIKYIQLLGPLEKGLYKGPRPLVIYISEYINRKYVPYLEICIPMDTYT